MFILCCSIFLLWMHVCFCCVRFSFLVFSQDIGWEEHLQNDLFCVRRDINLNSVNQSRILMLFSGASCIQGDHDRCCCCCWLFHCSISLQRRELKKRSRLVLHVIVLGADFLSFTTVFCGNHGVLWAMKAKWVRHQVSECCPCPFKDC